LPPFTIEIHQAQVDIKRPIACKLTEMALGRPQAFVARLGGIDLDGLVDLDVVPSGALGRIRILESEVATSTAFLKPHDVFRSFVTTPAKKER